MGHFSDPRLPTGPFIEWCERELDLLRLDNTIALSEASLSNPPALRTLAHRLGITERSLRRYLRGLGSDNKPTATFNQYQVEAMLDHAGLHLVEVYPDVYDDIEVEPDAWCRKCREIVSPIKGFCPWCDRRTASRWPRGVRKHPPTQRVREDQLRTFHVIHVRYRMPIMELARQSYKRLGYASPGACDRAIRNGWHRLGLPALSQSQIMRAVQARREHEPPLDEQAMREAIWMHAQGEMSVEAVARIMLPRARVEHVSTLGSLLRDEFRARGVYTAKRRGSLRVERQAA